MSVHVRAWFEKQLGPSFRFDGVLREFFATADGTQTLGDALDLWHRTRGQARDRPAEQFEYNRFAQVWWAANPSGDRAQFVAAWHAYRALPADLRPALPSGPESVS